MCRNVGHGDLQCAIRRVDGFGRVPFEIARGTVPEILCLPKGIVAGPKGAPFGFKFIGELQLVGGFTDGRGKGLCVGGRIGINHGPCGREGGHLSRSIGAA